MKSPNLVQALIACAFLLASCSKPPLPEFTGIEITPELRAIMETGRNTAFPPLHPDFWEITAGFLTPFDPDEDLRVSETVRLNADPDFTTYTRRGKDLPEPGIQIFGRITREEAVEDVQFLFDILRNGYSGYGYFGGDSAFLPARDSVLADLAGMGNLIQKDAFLNLLARTLGSLVTDNHFILHNVVLGALKHVPYMNGDIIMRRTEAGLVTEIDGRTYRVLGTELLDGAPVEAIMPTLTNDGEIAWAFGRLMGYPDREITVLLEDEQSGERLSRLVSLSRVESPWLGSDTLLSMRKEAGITVLENRRMLSDGWENDGELYEAYTEFYRSGLEMRDKPILILDIRSHGGGFPYLAYQWISGYAGLEPDEQAAFMPFVLATHTEQALSEAFYPDDPDFSFDYERLPDLQVRYNRWAEDPDRRAQWILPEEWDDNLLSNNNFVIALTDYHVGSAGERFVGYLRQLENVLVVGTNTFGVLVTGGVVWTVLPRSNLTLQFSVSTLDLRPDLSQFEGIGLLPDLWVPPGESLERVLAFVRRYGIRR